MLEVIPHPNYLPEESRYLRGNNASPVDVAIILNNDADKIPPHVEKMMRAEIESGAVLSGTMLVMDRFAGSVIVGPENKISSCCDNNH